MEIQRESARWPRNRVSALRGRDGSWCRSGPAVRRRPGTRGCKTTLPGTDRSAASLSWLLPHAWQHELAAGASDAESTPGAVVLGPAASGTRGATSASAAVIVRTPLAGRQLAPEWPCLAARTWHSRLQNNTPRHRPQRSNLPPLLPHAPHEAGAIGRCCGVDSVFGQSQPRPR